MIHSEPPKQIKKLKFVFNTYVNKSQSFEGLIKMYANKMFFVSLSEHKKFGTGLDVNFTILEGTTVLVNGTAKLEAISEKDEPLLLIFKALQLDANSEKKLLEIFSKRQKDVHNWMRLLRDD